MAAALAKPNYQFIAHLAATIDPDETYLGHTADDTYVVSRTYDIAASLAHSTSPFPVDDTYVVGAAVYKRIWVTQRTYDIIRRHDDVTNVIRVERTTSPLPVDETYVVGAAVYKRIWVTQRAYDIIRRHDDVTNVIRRDDDVTDHPLP